MIALLLLQVTAVGPIAMTVSDADRATAFYTDVLQFEKLGEKSRRDVRIVELSLGEERVWLMQWHTPGKAIPADSRSNDRWFQHIAIVVSDMSRAYDRVEARHVQHVSTSPQRLPAYIPAAAGIEAFYFRDPDGHNLELIHFPRGKGDPKWQGKTERLFLGIDHTAIASGDTASSLSFYRDRLGMRVAGESENYGFEQEHLNGVFGSRVHITGLRAASGPGVELLDYLAPPGGRSLPDVKPNDLVYWQTTVFTQDAGASAEKDAFGCTRASVTRDPDGHALLLCQRNR